MHKRKVFALSAGAVALLLVAGGLMASNMGFKLNRVLAGTGGSLSGYNSLALPYNQQVGLVNCGQLGVDMGGFSGGGGPIAGIEKFNPTTNTYLFCATRAAVTTNFALTPGEAYRVKLAGAPNLNYIVVGSHDPAKTVVLKGTGSSVNGTNEFSYPYHSTAVNCGALGLELGGFAGGGGPVAGIEQFLPGTNGYLFCATRAAVTTNFALTPGFGYRVRVGSAADISFIPSHY